MKFLRLKPEIFKKFPIRRGGRTFFVIGQLDQALRQLRKRFVVASMKQIHGRISAQVNKKRSKIYPVDALYTAEPGIFLAVRTADCLPILFVVPKVGVVAAVHAGWKGTVAKILPATVQEVMKAYGARPQDFYFFFGPAARVCHYEITGKLERIRKFKGYRGVLRQRGDKLFLDFVKVNRLQLQSLGIKPSQIEDCGICTIHDKRFPSHRREGAGRHSTLLSLIGLRI